MDPTKMTTDEMIKYTEDHWKCVTLCRECEHYVRHTHPFCEWHTYGGNEFWVKPDWYCADGERRQEQEAGYDQNH